MKYRSEVDGLRAVAVLPVLFFHAGFTSFSGGFVGVDIFFVISGYLITSLIIEEAEAGSFSLLDFYERRFRRIVPALLVVVSATIPFAWAWMTTREFDDYAQSLFATNLSVSNFLFWKEANYFGTEAELKPLLHTWSLAVEEQFYLIFPLLLVMFGFRRRLIWTVAALVFASFALTQILAVRAPAANFYLLPTRFWELGVGALLALVQGGRPSLRGATSQTLSLAGLVLIIGAIFLVDGRRPFPGWWTLPPVVGTALILAFARPGTVVASLLSWRPLVAVGLISYSLYLWHQPLFAFARIRMFGDVPFEMYLALIALACVLSWLTWRFVEQPCRNRQKVGRRKFFAVIGVVGSGLITFGLVADQFEGLPLRHPDKAFAGTLEERMRINAGLSRSCDGRHPLPPDCMTSETPEILLWGDSYAMHLAAGIIQSRPDVGMVQFTKSVCGPFIDIAPVVPPSYPVKWAEGCLEFIDAMKRYVENTPSLRYAVVSSPFGQYFESVLFEGRLVQPSPEFVLKRLRITLEWLADHGVTPVIFAPPPSNGSDIGACLARSRWLGLDTEKCAIVHMDDNFRRDKTAVLLDALRREYRVVDVSEFLCDARKCKVEDDDVFIYRDSGHLSYEGSQFLGEKMNFFALISGEDPRPSPADERLQ